MKHKKKKKHPSFLPSIQATTIAIMDQRTDEDEDGDNEGSGSSNDL
jgi:hypothetical protein